jgi:phage terminase small subunit
MAGRPPKPIELHRLQGTDRPDRMAARETEFVIDPDGVGPAPEWLGEVARQEWERLAKHPQYSQVLCSIHWGVLIEYVVLFELMVLAGQKKGTISASQRQALNSLRLQLGISPSSQSRIKMPQKPKPGSSWDDLKPLLIPRSDGGKKGA